MGVKWLIGAVSKHMVNPNVKNVVINIGTNGAFNPKDNIKGLMTELRRVFPNAKFSVVQGSWGWGYNVGVTEDKVKKYYDRFRAEGVTVIEPPIGKVADPHTNLPVYDTIAKAIDGLVTNQSGYVPTADLSRGNSAATQIISRPNDPYRYKVENDHWLAKRDDQSRWYEISGSDFKPGYQTSIDILDTENPNMRSKNAPKKSQNSNQVKTDQDVSTPSPIINIKTGAKGKTKANDWSNSTNFFVNSEGKNLSEIGSRAGVKMERNMGLGKEFEQSVYERYKEDPNVHWCVYDISNDKVIANSKNAKTNVYGASVPKVCVAAAAFNKNNGTLPTDRDYEKVIKLLVKSDNGVWNDIQNLAGGSSAVNDWASSMGYTMKPARNGGNSSNAYDMCRFWNDVCRDRIQGSENIFKITSSCSTDSSRGRKCMPKNVFMGGKTGTYNTANHDAAWIYDGSNFYSICVLTELGALGSNVIAQTFRGLWNEYIKK